LSESCYSSVQTQVGHQRHEGQVCPKYTRTREKSVCCQYNR